MCVVCKYLGIKVGYQTQIRIVAVLRTSQFLRQQQALPHQLCCITSNVATSHGMCRDDIALAAMMSSWCIKGQCSCLALVSVILPRVLVQQYDVISVNKLSLELSDL